MNNSGFKALVIGLLLLILGGGFGGGLTMFSKIASLEERIASIEREIRER